MKERPRIYQLMLRHFGNTREGGVPNGSIEENGCGKFADIDENALRSLGDLGFTHLWLTGALEHASLTEFPGRPADHPAIVKGRAGSPYAIRDYFDLSPDYAVEPAARREEFRALLVRCEEHGLRPILDFVPNHVARSYHSDVRPELSFGSGDRTGQFFDRDNNFFYLGAEDPGGGPPLELPAPEGEGEGTVEYGPESEFGRVTGNNVRSWAPTRHDWYETVKLNYGHDFTAGRDTSHLPGPEAAADEVPDTWRKMDAVLAYWQEMGVRGFRADMAHMIPMEFWRWAITRARVRARAGAGGIFFMAEAYDGDPAKLTEGNVLEALVENGFDAVYDSASYELVREIYEGPKWANDLDGILGSHGHVHAVRYAENHDEVRLASPLRWGGHGMTVGRAVSAVLLASARGPLMIYNGQEVGEPAVGASGFSGDDGRSSIFDYGSLPELAKWVNGHRYDGGRLSPEQRALRGWYGRLLALCAEPALTAGEFLPLNAANSDNAAFGRLHGESASGHWLYAFLRRDRSSGQCFLVVANLHGTEAMSGVRVRVPVEHLDAVAGADGEIRLRDRLGEDGWHATVAAASLAAEGLALPALQPASALFLEITSTG